MPVAAPGTQTSTPPVVAPPGGVLSLTDLVKLAAATGFTGDHIPEAAAIAMAESSGRPTVVNSLKCVGLWQINQPVWSKSHPEWSIQYLQNPQRNAQAAKEISKDGTNWHPWSTYQGNAYQKFLEQAKKIAQGLPDLYKGIDDGVDKAVGLGPVEAQGGIMGGITSAIDSFQELIRKTALSYLVIFLALVLLILGIVILLRRQAVPLALNLATDGIGGTALEAVKAVSKK